MWRKPGQKSPPDLKLTFFSPDVDYGSVFNMLTVCLCCLLTGYFRLLLAWQHWQKPHQAGLTFLSGKERLHMDGSFLTLQLTDTAADSCLWCMDTPLPLLLRLTHFPQSFFLHKGQDWSQAFRFSLLTCLCVCVCMASLFQRVHCINSETNIAESHWFLSTQGHMDADAGPSVCPTLWPGITYFDSVRTDVWHFNRQRHFFLNYNKGIVSPFTLAAYLWA